MLKSTITRLVVMLFVLTLLAAGCAKKPATEEPATSEQTTQMDQQQPAAVEEQAVTDTDTDTGYDAEAAARNAERAAAKGLETIHFDFDQYVLTDDSKSILVNNAGLLRSAPAVKILIEGHCDERGSDEYNLALGEKRALATKNYLVSLGVGAERMSVISYGEEMPFDSAHNKAAWAKNRRANFKVKR